jgi:methionyl aminopeptidase
MGVHSTQALETPRRSPREERHGAIALRSSDDMAAIERAGAAVAAALELAEGAVRAGATTLDVDAAVRTALAAAGAEPAFVNYPHPTGGPAFPAAACVSVGNEVVHGVPGARTLRAGDVVSIDVGARVGGWCADAAVTVTVPGAGDAAALAAFVADAWETLHAGIALMQPGQRWSDVADRMQRLAVARGHGMVDGWHGHGVGRQVHEAPQAPSLVSHGLRAERDFTLLPGMVLAVEPILVLGGRGTIDADGCMQAQTAAAGADGWTVALPEGSVVCHVEHTVAVTRSGPRILTRRPANRAGCDTNTNHGGCGLTG